jgi:cell shape-determining protein MreC
MNASILSFQVAEDNNRPSMADWQRLVQENERLKAQLLEVKQDQQLTLELN